MQKAQHYFIMTMVIMACKTDHPNRKNPLTAPELSGGAEPSDSILLAISSILVVTHVMAS